MLAFLHYARLFCKYCQYLIIKSYFHILPPEASIMAPEDLDKNWCFWFQTCVLFLNLKSSHKANVPCPVSCHYCHRSSSLSIVYFRHNVLRCATWKIQHQKFIVKLKILLAKITDLQHTTAPDCAKTHPLNIILHFEGYYFHQVSLLTSFKYCNAQCYFFLNLW